MAGRRVSVQTWGIFSVEGWMGVGWKEWLVWVLYLPWVQFFSSRGQHRFLQSSSQSAGVLLCPPCWDMALFTLIPGICVGRPNRMPATSLAIHFLMGLGMSLEPGFPKLYFNGFTLANPSESCMRGSDYLYQYIHATEPTRTSCQGMVVSGQISTSHTDLQDCW